jgi:7-cyano-7-deazaguanine synthase in queuosine biosynthesis
MIEFFKIGDYQFPYDPTLEKVGLKISGGADSSLIAYILGLLKSQGLIKSQIITMTNEHHDRPYQIDYTNKILNYITQKTGSVFEYRCSVFSPSAEEYNMNSSAIVQKTKNSLMFGKHYMGITANPPIETGIKQEDLERTHDRNKLVYTDTKITPWINYDKKDIANIYKQLDIMELFSMTRSCENKTFDFTKHCGECWWCIERKWGFGKYE